MDEADGDNYGENYGDSDGDNYGDSDGDNYGDSGGISKAEALEHVHPNDRLALEQAMQTVLNAPVYDRSDSAVCEYRLQTPRGWQWVTTTMAVTHRDARGQPLMMLGVNHNIQDYKNRERDISALQHKLECIISALQAGVIEVNAYGEIVYVNPEACEMLDTPAGQVLTQHYRDAPWQFYNECGEPLDTGGTPLIATSLELGRAIHDVKLGTKNPRKWFNVRAQPLFDEQNRVTGVMVSLNDITALENSRREFIDLSARFVNILENTSDAFLSLDRQWRFTYLNQQAEHVLNRRRGELLGEQIWEQYPDAEIFRYHYERVFREHTPVMFETYYAPLDVHFEVHAYPFNDELGVFFRDISNRQKARKRLLESEERFRRSFELSPLGMVIVTPERQYIRANENFCQMIGYREDEVVGNYTADFTYPDDVEKTKVLLQQLFADEIPSYTIDKRYEHKQGHDVWARLSVSLVRDEQGIPLYMIGQIQDLTEQLEREAAYQTIVDHALQGFVLLQEDQVVLANPAAVAMLGYTEQEMYAWRPEHKTQIIHEKDVRHFSNVVRRITSGQIDAFQGMLRFMHRHGIVRWAEVYFTSLPYKGATAVQLAFVDVTDRQNAQEEVKRALVERTVLLQEVHHRVRNNLQVIASMLNLQTKRLESIAAKHALEDSYRRIIAMAGVHRALHESEDLANIDFAAYLQGFMRRLLAPEHSEVQLETALESTFLSAEQAIPCALIVNELVSNVLEHAFADDAVNNAVKSNAISNTASNTISNTISNIASNTVNDIDEATQEQTADHVDQSGDDQSGDDQGGDAAWVYVRLQCVDDIVTISIADNGIGMSLADRERDTLGMTIVRSLVGQLDATLDIRETWPGKARPGTTVLITFTVTSSQL